MRVIVDEPEGWRTMRDGDWTLVSSPDQNVRVLLTPLVGPAGVDPRQMFERDVPPDCRVEYVAFDERQRTRSGWAMAVTTLRVLDAQGVERERRLAAVVMMLTYLGAIVARLPSEAVLEREREGLLALFASARPRLWSKEPACVAELFTMEEP
jgi:hypothetical protein